MRPARGPRRGARAWRWWASWLWPFVVAAAEPVDLGPRLAAAAPGATIVLPAGTYRGPLVLIRPVHLRGEPGATILGDGQSSVIELRAPDIEVSGLIVRHSGNDITRDQAGIFVAAPRALVRGNTIVDCLHGIYAKAATDGRIEDNVVRGRAEIATVADPLVSGLKLTPDELCSTTLEQNQRGNGIHLWKSRRIEVVGNDIRGTRDGIYFSFTNDTHVADNHVSQVRYGLHYMYSDRNRFERNTFIDNAAGSALMFSRGIVLRQNRFLANRSERAYGLLLHTVDETTVEENLIEGNTVGLFMESNNANRVIGNRIVGNYIGLHLSDSSDANVFARNSFVRNIHPIETAGANPSNVWTDGSQGNYWDDAVTLDLNGDGIADLAHREADVFGAWRREFPAIGLLSGSPGERLVRFLYSRVPVRGIAGVIDGRPLVHAASP
jgi:nitrous oxidase accessory protein